MPLVQPTPGPIILASDLERAVCEKLREWMPFYAADIDEQKDLERGTTTLPRFYDAASDDERRWLEETPPSVLVVSPGTTGDPERHGKNAAYGAMWQLNIVVTASGATEAGSRDLASRLGGAIMYVATQQGDFGDFVEETFWRGIRLDKLDRERPTMIAEAACECWIPNVVATRGPKIPRVVPDDPTQPADPIPAADSATADADFQSP